MSALMMDDILDIGSSRWRGRAQEMERVSALGTPQHFMLPSVENVRHNINCSILLS